MNCLKEERLKRTWFPRGYLFDLTAYCWGCWTKLGRITNRGKACPKCHRKVCKDCKTWTCDTKWVCVNCTGDRRSSTLPARNQHRYSPGTYHSRNSGLFNGRKLVTIHKPDRPYEFIARHPSAAHHHGERNRKVLENIRAMSQANVLAMSPFRNKYSFSIPSKSENVPGETRPQKSTGGRAEIDGPYPLDDTVDGSAVWREFQARRGAGACKARLGHTRKKILWGGAKFLDGIDVGESTMSQSTDFPELQRYANFRRSGRSRTSFFGYHRRPPHPFERNGTRGRRSAHMPCLGNGIPLLTTRESSEVRLRRSRSVNFPIQMSMQNDYMDIFRNAFVEYRVRRLEEDLNAFESSYSSGDVHTQSLMSLDLDRDRITDAEGYRLVYLSSSHTSIESYSEYSGIEFLPPGTILLPPIDYRTGVSIDNLDASPDWEFSDASSNDEKTASTETDELTLTEPLQQRVERNTITVTPSKYMELPCPYNKHFSSSLNSLSGALPKNESSCTLKSSHSEKDFQTDSFKVSFRVIGAKTPLTRFLSDPTMTRPEPCSGGERPSIHRQCESRISETSHESYVSSRLAETNVSAEPMGISECKHSNARHLQSERDRQKFFTIQPWQTPRRLPHGVYSDRKTQPKQNTIDEKISEKLNNYLSKKTKQFRREKLQGRYFDSALGLSKRGKSSIKDEFNLANDSVDWTGTNSNGLPSFVPRLPADRRRNHRYGTRNTEIIKRSTILSPLEWNEVINELKCTLKCHAEYSQTSYYHFLLTKDLVPPPLSDLTSLVFSQTEKNVLLRASVSKLMTKFTGRFFCEKYNPISEHLSDFITNLSKCRKHFGNVMHLGITFQEMLRSLCESPAPHVFVKASENASQEYEVIIARLYFSTQTRNSSNTFAILKTLQSMDSLKRNALSELECPFAEFQYASFSGFKFSISSRAHVNGSSLPSYDNFEKNCRDESGEIVEPITTTAARRENSQYEVNYAARIDTAKTGRAAFNEFRTAGGRPLRPRLTAESERLANGCGSTIGSVDLTTAVQPKRRSLVDFPPSVDENPKDVTTDWDSAAFRCLTDSSDYTNLTKLANLGHREGITGSVSSAIDIQEVAPRSVVVSSSEHVLIGDGGNMSTTNGVRGSKIAELKKIFDPALNQSDCDNRKPVVNRPKSVKTYKGENVVTSDKCVISDNVGITKVDTVTPPPVYNGHGIDKDYVYDYAATSAKFERNESERGGSLSPKSNSFLLWKDVKTGHVRNCQKDSNVVGESDRYSPNSKLLAKTTELNHLIATTKAELSRTETVTNVPEKSTLENYFAHAFDNSVLSSRRVIQPVECDRQTDNNVSYAGELDDPRYECYMDEMFFDDLDDGASDASSDEDTRCDPTPPINHHLQPYSLHTIIEESCEESERESEAATPTNQPPSKLEKYFSWDIVNDVNRNVNRDSFEGSMVYSDSLSDASSSLNEEDNEVEPSPLSSSRLEKYFMLGLVGNESYNYPDDAEFLDDTSISDFDEEDRGCHKISRSALLTSLDLKSAGTVPNEAVNTNLNSTFTKDNLNSTFTTTKDNLNSTFTTTKDNLNSTFTITEDDDKGKENVEQVSVSGNQTTINISSNSTDELKENRGLSVLSTTVSVNMPKEDDVVILDDYTLAETEQGISNPIMIDHQPCSQEHETYVENVRCKISVIPSVIECSEPVESAKPIATDHSLTELVPETKDNVSEQDSEMKYISAWQLLENEIEQLVNHVASNSNADNNSRTSSTIGSSNSDYGSDTIELGECLTTDEDDNCTDSKLKAEQALKVLVDDNGDICRKILESFKKHEMAEYLKLADGSGDLSHSAIKEYVVSLMKNAHVAHMTSDVTQLDVKKDTGSISEAEILRTLKREGLDEGISVDSVENLYSDSDAGSSRSTEFHQLTEEKHEQDLIDTNQLLPKSCTVPDELEITAVTFDESCKHEVTVHEEEIFNENLPLTNQSTPIKSLTESQTSLDDTTSQVSVYVDIQIGSNETSITERKNSPEENETELERPALHMWASHHDLTSHLNETVTPDMNPEVVSLVSSSSAQETPSKSPSFKEIELEDAEPDPSYYNFNRRRSSTDSVLYAALDSGDVLDSSLFDGGDIEILGRSSIRSVSSKKASKKKKELLSKSTTNLPEGSDIKFSTLQPKSRTLKVSMHPQNGTTEKKPSPSFFSASSSVLKKFLPRNNSSAGSTYPSKYLKKYGRSSSFDSESITGAMSMPHLGISSDSQSVNGDCDRESSITLDDDVDGKHSGYSHSILSLGAHSSSTTSVYSAAGGRHFGYVSVTGDVLFGLNYNQKSQSMEVFVKQCRNLASADTKKNRSDPYVKVYLLPDKSKGGKRKTKTKKNTLNPVFNELLRFPVLKHELESRTLWLSVWNSDLFGRNDFLGEVSLNLGHRLLDSPTLRWYPLQERSESPTSPLTYKGELFIALKYVPKDLSLEPRFRPAPVISLKGALHVLIKEARNISQGKNTGTFDSFCKCYLLPDKSKTSKQKTPVIKRTRHPKWYYTIIYEDMSIEELKDRCLELTLWDHDKLTSNEFVGGIRLNAGTGLYHGIPIEWMDSTREESVLWNAMLERPNMWVDGSLMLRPTMQSLRS